MRPLAVLGDSVSTDHLSPARCHRDGAPARGSSSTGASSRRTSTHYGTRRGNHEVAVRATFANIRLRNKIVPGVEGAMTEASARTGEVVPIFDAAPESGRRGVPLVIVAGATYG